MIVGLPSKQSVGLGYRASLLSGDAGTAQTIKLMRKLVDQALSDSSFVRFAKDIVRHVPAHDEFGETQAIYDWVLRNIRFTKDPLTKESLYPPQELLKIRAGDCDDISMLLGALLLADGYPAQLVTVAANPQAPDEFSHVYVEVELPPGSGNWMAMDAARLGAQFGVAPAMYYRKRVWSLVDDSYQDMKGIASLRMTRLRGLAGYTHVAGLGDDGGFDWSSLATDIIQETPQIMAIASGQPTKSNIVATGPYATFATSYTPGATVPMATYPVQPSVSGSITASSLLPLLLFGGVLLMMMKR